MPILSNNSFIGTTQDTPQRSSNSLLYWFFKANKLDTDTNLEIINARENLANMSYMCNMEGRKNVLLAEQNINPSTNFNDLPDTDAGIWEVASQSALNDFLGCAVPSRDATGYTSQLMLEQKLQNVAKNIVSNPNNISYNVNDAASEFTGNTEEYWKSVFDEFRNDDYANFDIQEADFAVGVEGGSYALGNNGLTCETYTVDNPDGTGYTVSECAAQINAQNEQRIEPLNTGAITATTVAQANNFERETEFIPNGTILRWPGTCDLNEPPEASRQQYQAIKFCGEIDFEEICDIVFFKAIQGALRDSPTTFFGVTDLYREKGYVFPQADKVELLAQNELKGVLGVNWKHTGPENLIRAINQNAGEGDVPLPTVAPEPYPWVNKPKTGVFLRCANTLETKFWKNLTAAIKKAIIDLLERNILLLTGHLEDARIIMQTIQKQHLIQTNPEAAEDYETIKQNLMRVGNYREFGIIPTTIFTYDAAVSLHDAIRDKLVYYRDQKNWLSQIFRLDAEYKNAMLSYERVKTFTMEVNKFFGDFLKFVLDEEQPLREAYTALRAAENAEQAEIALAGVNEAKNALRIARAEALADCEGNIMFIFRKIAFDISAASEARTEVASIVVGGIRRTLWDTPVARIAEVISELRSTESTAGLILESFAIVYDWVASWFEVIDQFLSIPKNAMAAYDATITTQESLTLAQKQLEIINKVESATTTLEEGVGGYRNSAQALRELTLMADASPTLQSSQRLMNLTNAYKKLSRAEKVIQEAEEIIGVSLESAEATEEFIATAERLENAVAIGEAAVQEAKVAFAAFGWIGKLGKWLSQLFKFLNNPAFEILAMFQIGYDLLDDALGALSPMQAYRNGENNIQDRFVTLYDTENLFEGRGLDGLKAYQNGDTGVHPDDIRHRYVWSVLVKAQMRSGVELVSASRGFGACLYMKGHPKIDPKLHNTRISGIRNARDCMAFGNIDSCASQTNGACIETNPETGQRGIARHTVGNVQDVPILENDCIGQNRTWIPDFKICIPEEIMSVDEALDNRAGLIAGGSYWDCTWEDPTNQTDPGRCRDFSVSCDKNKCKANYPSVKSMKTKWIEAGPSSDITTSVMGSINNLFDWASTGTSLPDWVPGTTNHCLDGDSTSDSLHVNTITRPEANCQGAKLFKSDGTPKTPADLYLDEQPVGLIEQTLFDDWTPPNVNFTVPRLSYGTGECLPRSECHNMRHNNYDYLSRRCYVQPCCGSYDNNTWANRDCWSDWGNCDDDRYGGDASERRYINYCDNVGYEDDWENAGLREQRGTGKWVDSNNRVHRGRVRVKGV